MMQTQMANLSQLLASNAMGGAGEGQDETQDYMALIKQYTGADQQNRDAQQAGRMGRGLMTAGLAIHPALALAGGLMAWKAKNSINESQKTKNTALDELFQNDNFKVMDLYGEPQKRGLGERFKGVVGSYF